MKKLKKLMIPAVVHTRERICHARFIVPFSMAAMVCWLNALLLLLLFSFARNK
jgi:hypothetical protein